MEGTVDPLMACIKLCISPIFGAFSLAVLWFPYGAWWRSSFLSRAFRGGSTHRPHQFSRRNRRKSVGANSQTSLVTKLSFVAHWAAFSTLAYTLLLGTWEAAKEATTAGLESLVALVVGLILGVLLVRFLESSSGAAFLRRLGLGEGSLIATVLFVHAALEGAMMVFLSHSSAFASLVDSVVVHNIPEGFIVAVGLFTADNRDMQNSGYRAGGEERAPLAMESAPTSPTTPSMLGGPAGDRLVPRQWLLLTRRAAVHSFVSHIGQAVALGFGLLALRWSEAKLVLDLDDGRPSSSGEPTAAFGPAAGAVSGLSLGSMLATLIFELLPQLSHVALFSSA